MRAKRFRCNTDLLELGNRRGAGAGKERRNRREMWSKRLYRVTGLLLFSSRIVSFKSIESRDKRGRLKVAVQGLNFPLTCLEFPPPLS